MGIDSTSEEAKGRGGHSLGAGEVLGSAHFLKAAFSTVEMAELSRKSGYGKPYRSWLEEHVPWSVWGYLRDDEYIWRVQVIVFPDDLRPTSRFSAVRSKAFEARAKSNGHGIAIGIEYDEAWEVLGHWHEAKARIPQHELFRHLRFLDSGVRLGREPVKSNLPLSDEKIFDAVQQRGEWIEEYTRVNLEDAFSRLAWEFAGDDASDEEVEELELEVRRAYNREIKRRQRR